MNMKRNIIMRRFLILTVSVGLLTGYGEIYAKKVTTTNGDNGTVMIAKQLKDIDKSKAVTIADDSYASIFWIPKNQNSTLYKIESFLKQAKLYKCKIPKSHISGIYHAKVEPSKINITIDKSNEIVIQPAFYAEDKDDTYKIHYIDNVLNMIRNNNKIYIKSKDFFKWLKEDRWKPEFKYYER